jgi:hypothetical protein
MNEGSLKANNIKIIMIIIIVIMIAGSGFSFFYTLGKIKGLVIDTNTALKKASTSNITSGGTANTSDKEMKNLIDITNDMLYNQPTTLTDLTNDLTKYANESGVTLKTIDPTANTLNPKLPTLFEKIKSQKFIIAIGSPTSFNGLMKFIKAIETNNPKIQISRLNLSNIRANAGDVAVEPIVIEVYNR